MNSRAFGLVYNAFFKIIGKQTNCSNWFNSHFIIERSRDGNSFQAIAKIDGEGNSNQSKKYHFKDNLLQPGMYYYRIQQVDFDGTTEIIGVRGVDLNCNDLLDFKIFPNPTQGELNVFFQ